MNTMVGQTLFISTIAGIISGGLILGTAVYLNRKRINKLFQRLFGMDADDTDKGYIIEIDERTKQMKEQMEQNQIRIDEAHKEMREQLEEINGGNK